MNSRKLIALFMVLALTGSALAAQQQRLYRTEDGDRGDLEATGVVGVQQHSIFIEIVVEKVDKEKEIHEFAAVVGLIKECKQKRNQFDNAVLWFNDQFLFGEKRNDTEAQNESFGDTLGGQPNVTNVTADDDVNDAGSEGFIGTNWEGTPRWGGCFIPDGFAHAIGGDDPFGTISVNNDQVANPGIQNVKSLISLDHTCEGCIFEYHSSFFVVDPNGNEWIVDKHLYPGSLNGNAFEGGCDDGESVTGLPDLRETTGDDQTHADTCKDDTPDDAENHDGSGDTASNDPLYEPLFSTHLQVNKTTGMGFADRAQFQFDDTSGASDGADFDGDGVNDTLRPGAIYPTKGSETREFCEDNRVEECSIEYNFLLSVDFAAFDETGLDAQTAQISENEISRGCSVNHDEQGTDEEWWQGQSHTHSGNETPYEANDYHCHPTVNLDIFFYENGTYFTEQNQYWTSSHGTPLSWNDDCSGAEVANPGPERAGAISARSPIVCDDDADAPYHAHDGSQVLN